jgi:hypothetical protein
VLAFKVFLIYSTTATTTKVKDILERYYDGYFPSYTYFSLYCEATLNCLLLIYSRCPSRLAVRICHLCDVKKLKLSFYGGDFGSKKCK